MRKSYAGACTHVRAHTHTCTRARTEGRHVKTAGVIGVTHLHRDSGVAPISPNAMKLSSFLPLHLHM